MDEEGFRRYLKKGGRSPSAVNRAVQYVQDYETFLTEEKGGKGLEESDDQDVLDFVNFVESDPKNSAKLHLWAMIYYYQYAGNQELAQFASRLRQQRIQRSLFKLKDFRGVNQDYAAALDAVGISDVKQMLARGSTLDDREKLAGETGVQLKAILEFVKLSDLARVPGIKGIRGRLYYDAGVDTIEKMAAYDEDELLAVTRAFVERTGFDGIAPLPAEARHSIKTARALPRVVEYD